MLAQAIAQASGLPMNVGPCISAPAGVAHTASATADVHSTAARLTYPPVSALPTHITSGTTPACSAANIVPVRPKPVAISSRTSSTPCSSQSVRSTRRQAGL